MAKYESGFIGAGSMGGALAQAAVKAVGGERVAVSCSTPEHSAEAAARLGCNPETAETILWESRFVFLGVKPQMMAGLAKKLAGDIAGSDAIFVSMLAGTSLDRLAELLGAEKKIIRIMPNTPCAVGKGLTLVSANSRVTAAELADFKALMAESGLLDDLPEHLIDAASAVSGCGPAYAYMFVEALADGAVKQCGTGAGEWPASRRAEGRGVLPRRQHHRRGGGPGGPGLPGGGHGRRGSGVQAHKRVRVRNMTRTKCPCHFFDAPS